MDTKHRSDREGVRKPAGGFCFIRGTALLSAWAAYRGGQIQLVDLRVWFACREASARRCAIRKGRAPQYQIDEIRTLVGGTNRRIGESLRKLGRLGFVAWSDASVEFPEEVGSSFQDGFTEILDLVPNHKRLVPVPRRIIRRIAHGERRICIATILGHLLRCLYYKGGLCLPEGTCKASWIADVFGVDVRNVKSARKHLVSVGWLIPVATRQVHLNRFGARFRINLEWPSRNDINPLAKRSLLQAKSTIGSPPPYKDKKLSTRNEKPETRGSGPAGVFEEGKGKGPQLRNVRMEDLNSASSLCELFRQAVGEGVVKGSDMDRLNFFAAAEHARAVGTRNPCGLFVAIVRRGLWQHISLDNEDAAKARLRGLAEARGQRSVAGGNSKVASKQGIGESLPGRKWWLEVVPDAARAEIRKAIAESLGIEPFERTLQAA